MRRVYGSRIKMFKHVRNLQKSTSYECFLRKFVELRLHQNKGVNQEEDMGSRKNAKEA